MSHPSQLKKCTYCFNPHKLISPTSIPCSYVPSEQECVKGNWLAFNGGDVDFQNGFIEVRRGIVRTLVSFTKSHKIRRIDISPHLSQTLQQLKETRSLEVSYRKIPMPDWVFVWPENLARISDTTVRRLFYKSLEKAEMRRVRFYDLRHTFASLFNSTKS